MEQYRRIYWTTRVGKPERYGFYFAVLNEF